MSHSRTTRFLHVANGTSTTHLIEAAGIPGRLSIWADPLYEGPVPGGVSDDELLEVRARYLAEAARESYERTLNELRSWREVLDADGSYDELVLWFEHDLFDQLNLIQLLGEITRRAPAGKPVTLVCVGSFPGRPGFKGLGELTPQELAPLLDTRQRVTEEQYILAEHAWRAFRSPTPGALVDLRHTDTAALPFLGAAVTRFLQEYPWIDDGLSRSERRLLQLAGQGPIEGAAAFPQMHEGEDAYYITDLSFAALIDSLSSSSCPLISQAGDAAGPGTRSLRGTIALTGAGQDVLTGRRDRVVVCGLDRWLGGVHLQSGGTPWRWDEKARRVTAPRP